MLSRERSLALLSSGSRFHPWSLLWAEQYHRITICESNLVLTATTTATLPFVVTPSTGKAGAQTLTTSAPIWPLSLNGHCVNDRVSIDLVGLDVQYENDG